MTEAALTQANHPPEQEAEYGWNIGFRCTGEQTNNRGEISALLVALARAKPTKRAVVYTDRSQIEWVFFKRFLRWSLILFRSFFTTWVELGHSMLVMKFLQHFLAVSSMCTQGDI